MSDQEIVVGLVIGLLFAVLIYVIVNIEPGMPEKTKDSEEVEKDQDTKFNELIERNKDIINEFTEKVRAIPIGVFRRNVVEETFKGASSEPIYNTELLKKLYPDWYAYGDLTRDYLIKIAKLENREDVSPMSGELIPEWEKRLNKNPPSDLRMWNDFHMFLIGLGLEINDELHDEKEKNTQDLMDRLKFGTFWEENKKYIDKFFEILNKKVFSVDDYGDVIFSESIFNHEFQVFLKKVSKELENEDELKVFLFRKFQEYIKSSKS